MSLAERTREAVRARPFLHEALRAGIVNYTAAARYLDVGEETAVAAALRRYGAELEEVAVREGSVRVTMESGVGQTEENPLLRVGETALGIDGGDRSAILARGALSIRDGRQVLGRCETAEVTTVAFGATGETLVLVVERRDGPTALRLVEAVVETGPVG